MTIRLTASLNSLRPGDAYICIGNLTIIGSDNGLSPGQRQANIWTNDGIPLIVPWGTNFSEILIEIHTFSFKKMHLKMSSGKLMASLSWPQCVNASFLVDSTHSEIGYDQPTETTTIRLQWLQYHFMNEQHVNVFCCKKWTVNISSLRLSDAYNMHQ